MRDGAERDRSITEELTRFLGDNPDARVVDDQTAAPEDPRRKAERRTDLLLACRMVVVALGLLHFVTPWGETDTISILVDGFEDGDWAAAALSAAVLLICGCLLVPLPYVLLRSIRG